MARISYVDPETITDPQIRKWLEDAVRIGRPGPENQAIRVHQPDVMRSFTRREKIALRYADAILYDPAQADDKLWADLHAEFTEPELVELGYWVGFTFGGQRWLKTLSTKQGGNSRRSWRRKTNRKRR